MRPHVGYDIRDSSVARKKHSSCVLIPHRRAYGYHRMTGIRGGYERGHNNDQSPETCMVPAVRADHVNWQMPDASHACVGEEEVVVANYPCRLQVCKDERKRTEPGKGSWMQPQCVAVVTDLGQTRGMAPERL